ncbi:hypothetical protein ACFLY9_02015 [Patescibacteria group bacterium]
MKKRMLIIILLVLLGVGGIIIIYIYNGRYRELEEVVQEENSENEEFQETDLYPNLEGLIGQTLEEIKVQYPEGTDIESKTTWGSVYQSYEYENDLFILLVDGKDTGIVDNITLVVKKFDNCVSDESILDFVEETFPYAGFDPSKKGYANNPGIMQGAVSYYEYKEGYVLGLQCYDTPEGNSYYQVYYFENPY